MKKILTLLSCTVMLGIIALTVLSRSNESILKYSNLEKKYCHAFMLPDEKAFENPNALFNALKKLPMRQIVISFVYFFKKTRVPKDSLFANIF